MSHLTPGPDHAAPTYEVVSADTVEPKTKAAGYGGAAGGVLSTFVLWLLDELFWNGDALPPDVPTPVVGLVLLVIPALAAFAAAYYARHVNRLQGDV